MDQAAPHLLADRARASGRSERCVLDMSEVSFVLAVI